MKLMACPVSTITLQTWDILGLVNDCTDDDGVLIHLPFPGSVLDQPDWFIEARKLVKKERAAHRAEKMDAAKTSRGK